MGSTKATVRESFVQAVSLIVFLASLAVLTGCGEVESAEVTAKIVAEVDDKKSDMPPADRIFPFAHPMQYDARVSMRGAGEDWRHRFYVRKRK